ncbi:hypothetical protein [Actinosynnema pretiosum]|uniref:Uncharacterized protein n=1 Tax=Actinosynnema pretiosum TaxID=42197 RepID=A0A290Z4M8_9PSEU|nr:hypothetical protein [Actinosynnema pretiosum]ATE53976.1 hypothetical protein CNX65_12260 [Actinosynnema pretiosum]
MTGALGLAGRDVADVLTAAAAAGGRSCRFRLTADRIELHAESERLDARLAVGSALLVLRLALQERGVRALVTLRPPDVPGALAVVRLGGTREPDEETQRLLGAAGAAEVEPVAGVPVPLARRQALQRAAQRERAWLQAVDKEEMAWLGVPDAPLVAVLCTFTDGPEAEVQAGQALHRVQLAGACLGLTVRRDPCGPQRLRRALGGAVVPQVVLRIGARPLGGAGAGGDGVVAVELPPQRRASG